MSMTSTEEKKSLWIFHGEIFKLFIVVNRILTKKVEMRKVLIKNLFSKLLSIYGLDF